MLQFTSQLPADTFEISFNLPSALKGGLNMRRHILSTDVQPVGQLFNSMDACCVERVITACGCFAEILSATAEVCCGRKSLAEISFSIATAVSYPAQMVITGQFAVIKTCPTVPSTKWGYQEELGLAPRTMRSALTFLARSRICGATAPSSTTHTGL